MNINLAPMQDKILAECFDHETKHPFTIHDDALRAVRHDRLIHGLPTQMQIKRHICKTRPMTKTIYPFK